MQDKPEISDQEQAEQKRQKDLERLQRLRLLDDEFMRCFFRDRDDLVEFVLRIILNRSDLKVISSQTQKDMKRLGGARSIAMDVFAIDSTGKKYDIEIQKANEGADPYRARYYSSVMDVESLDAGQEFHELPETYIIFITEKDIFGEGAPLYQIDRVNAVTNKPFGDGAHIIYVNGEYRGNSPIGLLMDDFSRSNGLDMHFKPLADRTCYLKEDPEGVKQVSDVIEEIRQEGIQQGEQQKSLKIALSMLEAGKYALSEIANLTGLSLTEVQGLQQGQTS